MCALLLWWRWWRAAIALLDSQRVLSSIGAVVAFSCTVQRVAAFVDANSFEHIRLGGNGIGYCNTMRLSLIVVGFVAPDSQIARALADQILEIRRITVDHVLRLSSSFSRAAALIGLR